MARRIKFHDIAGWLLLAGSLGLIAFLFLSPQQDHTPAIIDVQVHYNQESWQQFSPTAIIGTLEQLNITSVVVSSTPDAGTSRLQAAGPLRVIPFLSLYSERDDRNRWFLDNSIPAYVENSLAQRRYRGIGEFHLLDGQVDTPVVRELLLLAKQHDLILMAHSDTQAIKQLYAMQPDLKIIWAHAGMIATPFIIQNMMYQYPTLWAEISHRIDIARDGELAPAWRELFLRYPERFMIGTGTYNNEYWYQFRYTIHHIRQWLRQLPPDVAELIAYKNAMHLLVTPPL